MSREANKNRVILCCSCPFCGEAVEIEVSKKEIKDIYQGFKMKQATAQLLGEKRLMAKYAAEDKEKKLREALSHAEFTAEEKQAIDKAQTILEAKTR